MSTFQKSPGVGAEKYMYLPAVLKKNKSGWLIEYYVEHIPLIKRLPADRADLFAV